MVKKISDPESTPVRLRIRSARTRRGRIQNRKPNIACAALSGRIKQCTKKDVPPRTRAPERHNISCAAPNTATSGSRK